MPRVMCPYHFWTFGLDGKLIAARGMPEGFDKSANGLREVAMENCGGLLFVCFAETPADRPRQGRHCRRHCALQPRQAESGGDRRIFMTRPTGSSSWKTTASAITAKATIPNCSNR
jgi:phenylpropionate dioxygenase-like ring-hydroxylating dioxygenase large terminal subunit